MRIAIVGAGGVGGYIGAKLVKSGQFDDTYTPSVRMLFDDEVKNKSPKKSITKTKLNS